MYTENRAREKYRIYPEMSYAMVSMGRATNEKNNTFCATMWMRASGISTAIYIITLHQLSSSPSRVARRLFRWQMAGTVEHRRARNVRYSNIVQNSIATNFAVTRRQMLACALRTFDGVMHFVGSGGGGLATRATQDKWILCTPR